MTDQGDFNLNDFLGDEAGDEEVPEVAEETTEENAPETEAQRIARIRLELRKEGVGTEEILEFKQNASVDSMDGLMYLSDWWKLAVAYGCKPSQISRATGKDRGMKSVLSDDFKTFWFGNRRVISESTNTDSYFQQILDQPSRRTAKAQPEKVSLSEAVDSAYTKKQLVEFLGSRDGLEIDLKLKKADLISSAIEAGLTAEDFEV